jgi:hypothetical protein
MWRKWAVGAVLALALLGSGCGGSQGYRDALASAFQGAPDNELRASTGDARCFADALLRDVGQERLERAGLTAATLRADGELDVSKLHGTDLDAFVDALLDCTQLVVATAPDVLDGVYAPPPDEMACVNAWVRDSQTFRTYITRAYATRGATRMTEAEAIEMVDEMFWCLDVGRLVAARYEPAGLTFDSERVACLRHEMRESVAAKGLYVRRALEGTAPPAADAEAVYGPMLVKCP